MVSRIRSDGDGSAAHQRTVIREQKADKQALQCELKRKEKALAEAAALLVLQKKSQALRKDKDD